MPNETRREFLRSSCAASAAWLVSGTSSAIEPIQRNSKTPLKISIAAYSYRKYLNLQQKPKPAMDLDDFIELAAEHGFDAVEPTAYYFAKTSPEYLAHLKAKCTRLGLDISGSAVGNNFCHRDTDRLQQQVQYVKNWIEHCARLGGKTLRIFAGSVPKGDTASAAIKRCIAAIEEACDYAAKFGVILALENHGGVTSTAEQMLRIVKGVKHDFFGVNLDSGNFHSADPYAELEQIAPYAVSVQLKTEIQRAGKKKEPADLPRLIKMLRGVGYRGYVVLEYEAAEEPKEAVPRHLATLRKLIN
ncbi:MAG: xylose isomerase [Gemmatales bacterium]|nr:MAG: xylose isomerase [Gemmatales bacterium]